MEIQILWDDMLWWPVNTIILGGVLPVLSASSCLRFVTSMQVWIFSLWNTGIVLALHEIYFIDVQNKVLI
jgi:hypothetical protein